MHSATRFLTSIRAKFLLLIILLLTSIFLVLALYQIRSNSAALREQLLSEVLSFSTLATEPVGSTFAIYKDSGTARIDQKVQEFIANSETISAIAVIDINGDQLYKSDEVADFDAQKADAQSFETVIKRNEQGDIVTIIAPYFESSGAHRFSVVYNVSNELINESILASKRSILFFAMFTLLTSTVLIYVLINLFIIRPVRQVSEQAGIISLGNLDQEITVHGRDEIALLGGAVNQMADSLKASIAELKEVDKVKSEFMMITSHNLRTPLTIITGYLDSIELYKNDATKLADALKRIGASAKRLAVFAEDVLTISRFELGEEELDKAPVVFGNFLERIAKDFRPTTEISKVTFTTEFKNLNETIKISAPHIRSAIWNLLDNATKFTSAGGEIRFEGKIQNNQIEITVSDNGVGIIKEEIPKLFTKFHRGTSTETYDFEGTGIGLYTSKVIIEKHGGTISVASEQGKGSTFVIMLPMQQVS